MADQIGLEQTPDAFVAELVAVFREVKRVLRDDGTLWLNLGDSYAGSGRGLMGDGTPSDRGDAKQGTNRGTTIGEYARPDWGLKPKDLVGIPWRVAFALQADGWYLRSDIIWHKPNPMPESVTDRPTKSHEYLFLLTKSASYYYDADAIAEPYADSTLAAHSGRSTRVQEAQAEASDASGAGTRHGKGKTGLVNGEGRLDNGQRNKRTVWTVPTSPYKGAHFATFPPDLIEPCIKAGSKAGDIVLDPFGGAGTTGLVADRLGRNAILCELNPEYAQMAAERVKGDNPMFTDVDVR